MTPTTIRQSSWKVVRRLGLEDNPALPLLDDVPIARTVTEVVGRCLIMSASAHCFYGFDRARALAWLKRERCVRWLTAGDREFFRGDDSNKAQMFWQIEGVWVLSWSVGAMPELDLTARHAPDNLVRALPDLPKDESAAEFRKRAKLRPAEEVLAKCDLAYCLHWALREASLTGKQAKRAPAYDAVYERRKALEWLLCDEPWDDVPMDT